MDKSLHPSLGTKVSKLCFAQFISTHNWPEVCRAGVRKHGSGNEEKDTTKPKKGYDWKQIIPLVLGCPLLRNTALCYTYFEVFRQSLVKGPRPVAVEWNRAGSSFLKSKIREARVGEEDEEKMREKTLHKIVCTVKKWRIEWGKFRWVVLFTCNSTFRIIQYSTFGAALTYTHSLTHSLTHLQIYIYICTPVGNLYHLPCHSQCQ